MFLGLLTLIIALSISAVAIYYSVAGLMTIFAAAAIPIMIMGGVLEIGKLVTAVWLHKYWNRATWWLKTYLTTAVFVLMFITSMGIFGFLSKAHIEQTASANEGIAQIERINDEIARNEQVIARAEAKIQDLETSGTGASNQLQEQIDREQQRIDGAYSRVEPAIEEQNTLIQGVTALFKQELDNIDQELATLQAYLDANDIEKAQAMVGTKVDGDYGPKTAAAFTAFQDRKKAERVEWLDKIQNAEQLPAVQSARKEIARLRATAEEQIAQSNDLINNLRNQLKSNDNNNLQTMLDEQNERVRSASNEIDTLVDSKFKLESEYRKLEAEVGPVKYIAEFVYGETADANLLEEAVRWVILVIIFVFDPLAVLLLIAAQYTFEFRRKELEDDRGERLRLEREEYERARAQRIVDNPGVTFDDPVPSDISSPSEDDGQKEEADVTTDIATADDDNGNVLSKDDITNMYASVNRVEFTEVQTDETESKEVESKKKDTSSVTEESTELLIEREQTLKEIDNLPEWLDAKSRWKLEHPNISLKSFKTLYIEGKIDKLPWEDYVIKEKKNYIMKQGNEQIVKEAVVSKPEDELQESSYIQNEEQENKDSIWKRIRTNNE